ncbi:MAG: deoxyhypusine synthase [Candidatus Omnitrophica bacterium]|nr:deoxyhypusine synthase [Candidatus Omnitrophota bacterium]
MKNKYLCRPRIYPVDLKKNMKVTDLVDVYTCSGSFQGGRLAEACAIFERMLNDPDVCIGLTIAGAMIPAGMGGAIIALMKQGFVDWIISTGANLYHDLHFALDLPVHQGSFRVDDTELLRHKIERIYDIFITEDLLLKTDHFVKNITRNAPFTEPVSTSQLHHFLGKAVCEQTPRPERSLLATACRLDIPVFTSSPADSSIGMNLAEHKLQGRRGITIDPDLDVLESCAYVAESRKNGVIILGGGSPKNFYLQTQPMIWQIIGGEQRGHDYDIQISTDSPQWGGLSGATPSEAVSWGKVNPKRLSSSVVVHCDATIAFPVLAGYILSRTAKKPLKRLYRHRDTFLKRFRTRCDEWIRTRKYTPER